MDLTVGQVAQNVNVREKGATLSQFCRVPI